MSDTQTTHYATTDTGYGSSYGTNCNYQQLFMSLVRPPFSDEHLGDIIFFQTDADYTTRPITLEHDSDKLSQNHKAVTKTEVPNIRLYGLTRTQQSVLVHLQNFMPYFYIEMPEGFKDEYIPDLCHLFNEYLSGQQSFKRCSRYVLNIEIVKRTPLLLYNEDNLLEFLKVTTELPRMVSSLRSYIESGVALRVVTSEGMDLSLTLHRMTYEANLPYILRFLLDRDIVGGSWLRLPEGTYTVYPESEKTSHCTLEVSAEYDSVIPLPLEGEWQSIGPIRTLSFDIECVKFNGTGFPNANFDPVIQISSVIHSHGTDLSNSKSFVFTLKDCDPLHSAHILCFENESQLLLAWSDFFRCVDPDFVTGYNIINFDFPYLITRATVLGLTRFTQLPRIRTQMTGFKENIASNNIMGLYENKDINLEGRIIFDVHDLVRRDYKLKSYSLNYVSFEFLKQQKEDVHYYTISKLQLGSSADRRRIASYCLKDAMLPLLLIDKLLLLYNYVEMARVTSTPIKMLISRLVYAKERNNGYMAQFSCRVSLHHHSCSYSGQQIRVTMQIYRQCKRLGYAIPVMSSGRTNTGEAAYEGATVLEPEKGYHKQPIAVLDFQSLYPSIMIAYNICYSTLIPENELSKYPPEDVSIVPGYEHLRFIKKHVRKGVLPIIVENLIQARKKAKEDMASCTDPMLKRVYDGRQLALKVTTNSVYGYTGAASGGFLPCVEVATAITSFGRNIIINTRDTVEKHFVLDNGYPSDARVVYGDTDSVMINFGVNDIERAIELGVEAAKKITEEAVKPITLVFEKVYRPLLLLSKKRYAGLLYSKADSYDKIDCKGIENVRRDFCLLVQQMMGRVLHLLLVELDLDGSIKFVKNKISELLKNEIDISLLVVTKSLGKVEYESRLPHVELAKKLRQRDPGKAPGVGDRVSYLIIKGTRGQPQFDRAEEPLHVVENNLPVDTQHYLDSIKSTLLRVFEVIMSNPESLFSGEHTRFVTNSSFDGGLNKFMKKAERCLSCKTIIKAPPFCNNCTLKKKQQIILNKIDDKRTKENDYFQLWTQCQRCQGSLHNAVICDNRDCPIFYKRVRTGKELARLDETFKTLTIEYDD